MSRRRSSVMACACTSTTGTKNWPQKSATHNYRRFLLCSLWGPKKPKPARFPSAIAAKAISAPSRWPRLSRRCKRKLSPGRPTKSSIRRRTMPKFLIEREIPGAGKLTPAELQGVSQKSCGVLRTMPQVKWVENYVTDDKIYCVYIEPNENAVPNKAVQGGFPPNGLPPLRGKI